MDPFTFPLLHSILLIFDWSEGPFQLQTIVTSANFRFILHYCSYSRTCTAGLKKWFIDSLIHSFNHFVYFFLMKVRKYSGRLAFRFPGT